MMSTFDARGVEFEEAKAIGTSGCYQVIKRGRRFLVEVVVENSSRRGDTRI